MLLRLRVGLELVISFGCSGSSDRPGGWRLIALSIPRIASEIGLLMLRGTENYQIYH